MHCSSCAKLMPAACFNGCYVSSQAHLWLRGHGAVQGVVIAARIAERERGQAVRGGHGGGRCSLGQQLCRAEEGLGTADAGLLQLVQRQALLPLNGLQALIAAPLHSRTASVTAVANSMGRAGHVQRARRQPEWLG